MKLIKRKFKSNEVLVGSVVRMVEKQQSIFPYDKPGWGRWDTDVKAYGGRNLVVRSITPSYILGITAVRFDVGWLCLEDVEVVG